MLLLIGRFRKGAGRRLGDGPGVLDGGGGLLNGWVLDSTTVNSCGYLDLLSNSKTKPLVSKNRQFALIVIPCSKGSASRE